MLAFLGADAGARKGTGNWRRAWESSNCRFVRLLLFAAAGWLLPILRVDRNRALRPVVAVCRRCPILAARWNSKWNSLRTVRKIWQKFQLTHPVSRHLAPRDVTGLVGTDAHGRMPVTKTRGPAIFPRTNLSLVSCATTYFYTFESRSEEADRSTNGSNGVRIAQRELTGKT
jgi:hypothetical protein